jgi:3-dehydro-scyllo-inosose hydrolase
MSLWLKTDNPGIVFEDTAVGRLKKEIWDASDEKIDKILADYGIPSLPEVGKPGSYIQTTIRQKVVENRRRNDIVFIPVGCTENHGRHTISGFDSFMVSQIAEAVHRYTMNRGNPVNLALNPLNYGAHPYHHVGMPGTVVVPETTVREMIIAVMLGLWNDGFRKQIIINNHGQFWVLESALQEFMKRYQLPGIFQVLDWHRAVREFFQVTGREDSMSTNFIHADEAETSIGLLLFPHEMNDMRIAEKTNMASLLPEGHFDKSVDPLKRPHRWSEGEGQYPIELRGTPEGVVGDATIASARKARRPVAAILSYLTLVYDEILRAFPAGTVPPVEKVTLRSEEEMIPYLKEPLSPGWKSVYQLPRIGQ